MKDHSRFLACLPLGLALAAGFYAACFAVQLGAPTESSRWVHELFERKSRTLVEIRRPALVLLGGSSTLFGLNAMQLERETGAPTVNLGTHAALWPSYLFHQARGILRKGDTVLLAPEYELYHLNKGQAKELPDDLLLDYIVSRDPHYFQGMPFSEQFNCFMSLPMNRLKHGLQGRFFGLRLRAEQPIYDSKKLNARGDQTGHLAGSDQRNPENAARPNKSILLPFPSQSTGLDEIRAFCSWARTHEVRVVASYPPLASRPEYLSGSALQVLEEKTKSFYQSLDVPVIGSPAETLYPVDHFFDTQYHLTQEASIKHTDYMARLLKPLYQTAKDGKP